MCNGLNYKLNNIDKYKYFVTNSNTSTTHFENVSQVHRTFMFTFMSHNGEGQSDENTKAAVLCI